MDRHAPYHARQVYEGQYGEKADVWSLLGEENIELGRKNAGFLSLGYPIYGCVIRENPKITWMMNRGNPILGNPQVWKLGTWSKSK